MDDDRLKGWKEIADFLHVRDRTAQRWEHVLGLPVHRLETVKSAIVFASRREVDTWLHTSEGKKARSEETAAGLTSATQHESAAGAEAPVPVQLVYQRPAMSSEHQTGTTTEQGLSDTDLVAGVPAGISYSSRSVAQLWWRRSRSWLTAGIVAAALIVLAYAGIGRLATSRDDARQDTAALPAGQVTNPSDALALRFTLADSRTFTVSQPIGVPTTVSLTGRSPCLVSAELTPDGVRIHLYRVGASAANANKQLEELATVSLKPGEEVRLPEATDVRTIEWLVKPVRRQPSS